MSASIALRGAGHLRLKVDYDLEIDVPPVFKDPLKIPLQEIAGFTAAEKDFRADRGTAWRRLPEFRRLDSSGLGMKFNLTIFFHRPQRLPRLRRKAVQSMAGSARKARQGVYIDAVILQAEDPAGATKALSRAAIREFQSYEEALETVVGIDQDPLVASRPLGQRAATRGRDYLRLRLFSLWVLLVPPPISTSTTVAPQGKLHSCLRLPWPCLEPPLAPTDLLGTDFQPLQPAGGTTGSCLFLVRSF